MRQTPESLTELFLFFALLADQLDLRDDVVQIDEVVCSSAQRVVDRCRVNLDGRDDRHHTPLSLQGLNSQHKFLTSRDEDEFICGMSHLERHD